MKYTVKKNFIFSLFIAISSSYNLSAKDILQRDKNNSIVYIDSCTGTSNQIQINKALEYVAQDPILTTVYLKGSMTCIIDEPILLSSNTKLKGDNTVLVKLKDNIAWNSPNKPLIGQKNKDQTIAWELGSSPSNSISNIEISGFELSGGIQTEATGKFFIILINLYNPSHVNIHNMNLHDSRGDIIRFYGNKKGKSNNFKIYNNKIKSSGHDGIYIIYGNEFEIYNNEVYETRTNSGIRASSSSNFSIHDNIIGNSLAKDPSGYAGILIDSTDEVPTAKIEIFNNYIYGKNGGIVLEGTSNSDTKKILNSVFIHHNRLYKINNYSAYLNGAIRINGFHNTIIEHNTIEASQKDGIIFDEHRGIANLGTQYQTIVRNNIISNSKGYGINNLTNNIHNFIIDSNNLYKNKRGNYNNTTATTDIYVNPLYVNSSLKRGWHHIVGTYSNKSEVFKMYIDGVEAASKKSIGFGNIATNNHYIFIGAYRAIAFWLKGRLDDIGVWNRCLNKDEILNLWGEGEGNTINSNTTLKLKAYWQLENNWNDVQGKYNSSKNWNNAKFTTDSKIGSFAGLFNGLNSYAIFPSDLKINSEITISAWVYQDMLNYSQNTIHTIFNKGSQEKNNHIWLYRKGDSFYFELGNGRKRDSVSSSSLAPSQVDLHLQSQYGHWNNNQWINDIETSPAINQGMYESPYSKEPYPHGGRVNLGSYGNTVQASKSFSQ